MSSKVNRTCTRRRRITRREWMLFCVSAPAALAAAPRSIRAAATIKPNGVVNAASLAEGIGVGSLFTVFGEYLALHSVTWDASIRDGMLPTVLDGVSVLVNGSPTYLAYVSPTQINAILPVDVPPGPIPIAISGPSGTATAATVLHTYAPALFADAAGSRAVATHANGSLVGPATGGLRPADPGEVVSLWGTGFGPTADAAPQGTVLTRAYPIATPTDLKVTIGGIQGKVAYAGLVLPGLYQINVVVPDAVAGGDQPIIAEIGGLATQSNVNLPIRTLLPGSDLTDLTFSYRLDPWLVSGSYGSGFWVSPPVFGPVTQPGHVFSIEARATGIDQRGNVVEIAPGWFAGNPNMVSLSPSQGSTVKINVRGPGESVVKVTSAGVWKDLRISALVNTSSIQVELFQ